MAQKKGNTGNPNGRPKGSKNRSTSEIKTAIQKLLDTNVSQMEVDLQKLSPKERISVLLKMAEFVLPKVQAVPHEGAETDNEIIVRIID